MTLLQALLAFSAAAALLTITPGLDTAMVLRVAAVEGPTRARLTSLGVNLGCLIWGGAAALGLAGLLAASETAFAFVKWAGAGYLFWLGANLVLRPRSAMAGAATAPVGSGVDAFRRGFLTNILNPKVGLFYVTLLPQFMPEGVHVAWFSLALTVIHVALGLVWFECVILATLPIRRLLSRPSVVRALDRATGGLFLAFGVKLALSRQ